MFYFLTTIRHPDNATDYARTLSMLALTFESISNQRATTPYRFLIVCNRGHRPDIVSDNVDFLEVDFPPAGNARGDHQALKDTYLDKGCKTAAGLQYLSRHHPDRVFMIDADDWVHRDLVETIAQTPDGTFWYVDRGFFVNYSARTAIHKHGLCRYCGSTFAYPFSQLMDMAQMPRALIDTSRHEAFTRTLDDHTLMFLLGNHRHQFAWMHRNGHKPHAIPLDAVSWVTGTGENVSGTQAGRWGHPLSGELLRDFGIHSISPNSQAPSWRTLARTTSATIASRLGWLATDKTACKV